MGLNANLAIMMSGVAAIHVLGGRVVDAVLPW
jgi:hypothetical protein